MGVQAFPGSPTIERPHSTHATRRDTACLTNVLAPARSVSAQPSRPLAPADFVSGQAERLLLHRYSQSGEILDMATSGRSTLQIPMNSPSALGSLHPNVSNNRRAMHRQTTAARMPI